MAEHELGLGNQAVLTKIDKLRELNIGTIIPLPQIVVVGDQSSGKSSLLESLTGFAFPRAPGLCTRYATQITCLDALTSYYKVSRKRFVDSICQQVVNHFLLEDEEGPLKILSPDLIVSLDEKQLETIAGEGAASKHKRQVLERKVEALTVALKVLRSN
ncbi:P-loop containing nucleoside triphosphate hydrolase protein [Xylaria longipes]|nr:P-loop containing nucleoside triphosphate hydrolase protein [Xylaria longipes]RYC60571.1 hypothetical protein CHU98_g5620 [Xylaria longipes]